MKKRYSFLVPITAMVTTERYTYPIPFIEIRINGKLTQNPGD